MIITITTNASVYARQSYLFPLSEFLLYLGASFLAHALHVYALITQTRNSGPARARARAVERSAPLAYVHARSVYISLTKFYRARKKTRVATRRPVRTSDETIVSHRDKTWKACNCGSSRLRTAGRTVPLGHSRNAFWVKRCSACRIARDDFICPDTTLVIGHCACACCYPLKLNRK